jgi:uncharacterized protein (UPF0332 family)
MSLKDEDRKTLIKYKLEKADKTIEDVQFLIDNNKLDIAINRVYYGIFYTLSALSLKFNFSTSKHQQLIGWFNKTFIKENIIDKKYGAIVHKAYENRSKSDYDDFISFSKEEVTKSFDEMKEFILEIKKVIEL